MHKGYHSGFDHFTPDPGTEASMNCVACGAVMDVERDKAIPLSRWSKNPKRVVDVFTCPSSGKKWHDQVIALRRFQRDTPSGVLTDLVEKEIEQIISSKQPSKENWYG